MSFNLAELETKIVAHGPVVRVVIAKTDGSAPREVGAYVLVWREGNKLKQSGTIGGGTLEFEAVARAFDAPRLQRIALGPALGQCCGGAVTLLTEVFADRAALPDADAVSETGAPFVRGPGDMPFNVQKLLRAARSGDDPKPQLIGDWMVEPISKPQRSLWVWGAGHVGRAVVDTIKNLPELEITWIDTAENRFPVDVPQNVSPLLAAKPEALVSHAPKSAEHLLLTYSHSLDFALCHQLLGHGFRFAGLIGSRSKWARFRSRLRDLGHADAQISRICCPIGQKNLGKHPQAIAIGVAAQLLSQTAKAESEQGMVG